MIRPLRAGIASATGTCLHCSRPVDRCACGSRDFARPHHGLAEVFLGLTLDRPRGLA